MWILCCSCGSRLMITPSGYRCRSCVLDRFLPREVYGKISAYLNLYTPKNIWSVFLLSYFGLTARRPSSKVEGQYTELMPGSVIVVEV